MPDLDRIERRLLPEWWPAYKLTKGAQPIEEVAAAIIRGLAALVRKSGGVPELPELARAIEHHDAGTLDDRSLAVLVRRLEQRTDSLMGKLLARAVLRPGVTGPASFLRGPPDERAALECLERTLEYGLFSKQRTYLVGKRFATLQEAIEFETRVRRILRGPLSQLARQLARNPSATLVRAPRVRRTRRKSTVELLDEPLSGNPRP